MRVVGWIFATALGLFFVLGPVGVAEAQSYEPEELAFLELINDYRQQNGLEPLGLSAPLSVASERHSEDMGTYGFFSHTTQGSSYYPAGSGHPERIAQEGYDYDTYTAENLAYGQATAAGVFEAWRVSPDHNVNMLGDYSVIGIGLAWVDGTPYWTAVFGAYADPSASGGSTDPGGGNDAETPSPPPPAEEEATEEQAATPVARNETAPEPGPQRESAAAGQYATPDQNDAGEARAGEPSGDEPTLAQASAERAAAAQYAEDDASTRSAGEQEAAGQTAATGAVSAGTSGADGTEAPEAEAAEADSPVAEAVETEAATEPAVVAEAEGSRSTGSVKTDDTLPSGSAGFGDAASAGITTLPDTGGVPLPLLVGGVVLLVGGCLARRIF